MRALQDQGPPTILLDTSPRAVEYQLGRLTADQLVQVERHDTDAKYRPVYLAILTRKGVARNYRDEALAAIVKLSATTPTRVLLEALGKVAESDPQTGERLLAMLYGQPADTLRAERAVFTETAASATQPFQLQGAYGALLLIDGAPSAPWGLAASRSGHLIQLLRAVPRLPPSATVAPLLFDPIGKLVAETDDAALRAEGLAALGWTRLDAATFRLLAREFVSRTDEPSRTAAVRSLQALPDGAVPAAEIEPLVRAIISFVTSTPAERRTEPAATEALQLGDRLANRLPDEQKRALRRELRGLGVHVVPITTKFEQMSFDLNWFAVEAGKPIQVVLTNADAMPHNLLFARPKSLQDVVNAAAAMPVPTDPGARPFVPRMPVVLAATNLLSEGDTERLNFTAPAQAGEYVFLCSYPGHWVRMYGVMLVVESLEAWEAHPTVPTDPITNQPYASQKK